MSDAVIDVTRRTRIRALAVRMYRAGIAGVFSVGGEVPGVDESALTDSQRAEAAKILEEQAAASIDIKDVETAASVSAIIPRYVKPSCPACHGDGIARRGGVDDICACVDRRWQADLDHQAFVEGLHAPGRALGARVESTRAVDDAKRLAEARAALVQAHAAVTTACANVDAEIKALEDEGAAYLAMRAQLDAHARANVEAIALRLGHLIAPLFQSQSLGVDVDDRAQARLAVDEVFDTAALVGGLHAAQKTAEEAARLARANALECAQRIEALDEENRPIVERLAALRIERARIARHHQPKIDRAEKRVRRLAYVTGSAPTEVTVVSQGESES